MSRGHRARQRGIQWCCYGCDAVVFQPGQGGGPLLPGWLHVAMTNTDKTGGLCVERAICPACRGLSVEQLWAGTDDEA
jgi:hypothetical protein